MEPDDCTRSNTPEPTGTRTLALDGAVIEIIEGPSAGERHKMRRTNVCVGSGEGTGVRVGDDNKMSRRHFELVATREGITLRDLDSRNGTFIQGCRIREGPNYGRAEIVAAKTRLL